VGGQTDPHQRLSSRGNGLDVQDERGFVSTEPAPRRASLLFAS
jgi:hypothetical protein